MLKFAFRKMIIGIVAMWLSYIGQSDERIYDETWYVYADDLNFDEERVGMIGKRIAVNIKFEKRP